MRVTYKKKKAKNGQVLLLNLLWKKLGGPDVVATKLKVPWYQPGNWNRDGQVPLKYIKKVSDTFDIPVWGLNYKVVQSLHFEDKIPSWKEVVKMYGFNEEDTQRIIKLGAP